MLTNQDVGSTVYCQVTSSVQTGSIRSAATAAVQAQNLSGIVKISGSLQVGQVLTAAVVDTNNTGKLSYVPDLQYWSEVPQAVPHGDDCR